MKVEVDHIVFAGAAFRAACKAFEEQTGCAPSDGGPHQGLGTRMALAGLEQGKYIEVIAPDPELGEPAGLGASLAERTETGLFHWVVRTDDLEAMSAALKDHGLLPTDVVELGRTLPDGRSISWKLMALPGMGGSWPMFIDWGDAPHPSEDAPEIPGRLTLRVRLGDDDPQSLPFAEAEGLTLESGAPLIEARFASDRGDIVWRTEEPPGFLG